MLNTDHTEEKDNAIKIYNMLTSICNITVRALIRILTDSIHNRISVSLNNVN